MSTLEAVSLVQRWDPQPPAPRRRLNERALVLLLAAMAYLTLAAYLILVRHAIFPDALSRVGNAQYVVSSRDPHLAAIGFVWNPLPSLLMVPFIPLRWLWPAAVSTGFLAGVQSALFMAGAVSVVRGTLADLGVSRVPRLALTLSFALHPMIVIYAYNGMSEAPLLFFTLVATRGLVGWLRDSTTRPLVVTGLSLALAYLTRYEAVAPGAAVIGLVCLVSLVRTPGTWREKRISALTDTALVGLPFAFAFCMWALLSRLIVKQWFPTLQSEYGNTAQVSGSRRFIEDVIGHSVSARFDFVGEQLLGLEPLLAVVLVLSLLVAALRRDVRVLAPIAVLGAVLAFDIAATVTGRSFGWLRFEISAVPLAVLLAGCLAAGAGRRPWLRGVAGLVALAQVAPALWLCLPTVLDRRLGREEARALQAVVRPREATLDEIDNLRRFDVATVIARDLDRADYGRGQVLTDAAFAFPVLLATRRPSMFVITPDLDFQRKLADPVTFRVGYLLVPDPAQATFDALNVAYPTLYAQGIPGSTLVREWAATGGGPDWRLYQVPAGTAPPPRG